jgi:hypothetical protein
MIDTIIALIELQQNNLFHVLAGDIPQDQKKICGKIQKMRVKFVVVQLSRWLV